MENSNENRRFCSACGAILTGTNFCGECGAKVLITAAHTPAPQEEVTPAKTVVEPVAPAAATLLDEQPAVRKFPLISVILMGVLVIMVSIQQIPQFRSLAFGGVAHLSAIFVLSCVELCCYIAILIGMMACKKQRNLAVALGFMALALCGMISGPLMIAYYRSEFGFPFGYSLYLSINNWIGVAFQLLIAIAYLIAKPKAGKLKMATCIAILAVKFLILVIDLIIARFSGAPAMLFNFLIYDATLYVSALLYTPFKE